MDIIKLDTIETYCKTFDFQLTHPLVGVVECNEPEKLKPYMMNWGFYALFLKDMASCTITYGKTHYDHGDKSIIAFAPGQVCAFEAIPGKDPKFVGVLFHPDFIHGTSLGQKIMNYSFFAYSSNEALHLSPSEFQVIKHLIAIIQTELSTEIDSYTHNLLCDNIQLLLDYCVRFYDRQFTTRAETNKDVLVRFERLLDEYLQSDLLRQEGLPTVRYFAEKICLSPNYFGDLIKKETGKTAQENIQDRIISLAKEWILGTNKTVSQIAYDLGFQYSQHFSRIFKKTVGCTPNEYRKSQMS